MIFCLSEPSAPYKLRICMDYLTGKKLMLLQILWKGINIPVLPWNN